MPMNDQVDGNVETHQKTRGMEFNTNGHITGLSAATRN